VANYRRIAFEHHERKCAECGATEKVEVHHRDGDRTNNDPENLLPLCKRHHSMLHRSGLNGLENELMPLSERPQIDPTTTTFSFQAVRVVWDEWKNTVPRTKPLDERIIELIEADTEGRISPPDPRED